MEVPFFSNHLIDGRIKNLWREAFNDVITNQALILGDSVEKFENGFAAFVGTKFGISTSNGLDGLVLALRVAEVSTGDYVAVPAHTFIATHLAILQVGAIPFSIDVDQFGLLNLDLLEASKIRFKAVIPVHIHGSMVDMRRLMGWAGRNNVLVIEDASQAHGCESEGIRAGQCGDLAVFSLYPTKNLGALGDAGIVLTSNSVYASKLRSLRNYGSSSRSKYEHHVIGYNNRLDTLQAAILNINLAEIDNWNAKRRSLAKLYEKQLSKLPVRFLIDARKYSVYHHFPILTEKREILKAHLATCGVTTEIHYPHLASNEIRNLVGIDNGRMAQGELISSTTLSLPLSQWHSGEQIEYVSSSVLNFFEENQ